MKNPTKRGDRKPLVDINKSKISKDRNDPKHSSENSISLSTKSTKDNTLILPIIKTIPFPINKLQDKYKLKETEKNMDSFKSTCQMKELSSITTREHFKRPSPIKFSQQEKEDLTRKSTEFQTPSQSSSRGEKRGIKLTIVISDDDEFIKSTGRSNIKSNVMDKAKSVEKSNKYYTRSKNSNISTFRFTNSNETEVELKTQNVQSSFIDDFYEPSIKRDEISIEQGTNKAELFKKPRRSTEQKDSGIPLSKRNKNVKKPGVTGVTDKKSISHNGREKLSRIINEQSLQISNDDDFIITKPNSNPKQSSFRAWSPQPNSGDDDFLDVSLIPIKNLKKRNNVCVRPNDLIPRYYLRPRKFHATEIIDDESEALNNQSEEFRVPSPRRNKYANLPEMDLLSEEEIPIKNNSQRKREGSAEHDQCPFCDEPIPFPLPERIRAYLIKINSSARDKSPDPPLSVLRQHFSNVIDRFEFCRLHYAETHTVPEGLKKNYPINIDFDRLPERVENLISELTLVIKGKQKSLYRDVALNAYQELGRARARKPTFLMGRFQKFQPGYYGSKGASIILSSLVSLLMDTNILTMDMTKPQEPLEYLSQVLVPETAIRLISHDQCITIEEAITVMEDSAEFGMYVHDIDEI